MTPLFCHSRTQPAHFLQTQESCYFVFSSLNVPEARVTQRAFRNPQWLTQCPCIANGMQTFRQPCLHKPIPASQLLKLGRGSEVSTDKLWMLALQDTRQTLTRAMACLPHWAAGVQGHAVRPDKGVGFQVTQCKQSTRVRTSSAGDKLRFQLCPSVLHSGFRTLQPTLASSPIPALPWM